MPQGCFIPWLDFCRNHARTCACREQLALLPPLPRPPHVQDGATNVARTLALPVLPCSPAPHAHYEGVPVSQPHSGAAPPPSPPAAAAPKHGGGFLDNVLERRQQGRGPNDRRGLFSRVRRFGAVGWWVCVCVVGCVVGGWCVSVWGVCVCGVGWGVCGGGGGGGTYPRQGGPLSRRMRRWCASAAAHAAHPCHLRFPIECRPWKARRSCGRRAACIPRGRSPGQTWRRGALPATVCVPAMG